MWVCSSFKDATTNKAASLVRGHLDIERILKDMESKAAANPRKKTVAAGSTIRKAVGTSLRMRRRGFSDF